MSTLWGASGACFGLLGAYLACWPNDKIIFPLIFLIREWPVGLVAVIRLGFEVYYVYGAQSGTMGSTNVAHLAHIGGFFLCFAMGRLVAKGAPSELDDSSTSPYSMGGSTIPKIPELMQFEFFPAIIIISMLYCKRLCQIFIS